MNLFVSFLPAAITKRSCPAEFPTKITEVKRTWCWRRESSTSYQTQSSL